MPGRVGTSARRAPGLLALACAALLAGCRAPHLHREPFSAMRAGAVSVSYHQPLVEDFHVEGAFELDPPTGEDTLFGSDEAQIEGKFGAVVELEYFVRERLALLAGLDYRIHDVRGQFAPEDLTLPVRIGQIDELQGHVGFRMYFELEECPRLRPFLGGHVAYLPGIDVQADMDLDEFIPGQMLQAQGRSDELWMLGLTGGATYQWTDHILLKAGALWELPLDELRADLPIDLPSALMADPIPFRAELEPSGPLVWVGASVFL